MHQALTPEQEALRAELRAYFEGVVTPEVAEEMSRGEMGGPACLEAVRQMGRDNWLAISFVSREGYRCFRIWSRHSDTYWTYHFAGLDSLAAK